MRIISLDVMIVFVLFLSNKQTCSFWAVSPIKYWASTLAYYAQIRRTNIIPCKDQCLSTYLCENNVRRNLNFSIFSVKRLLMNFLVSFRCSKLFLMASTIF